MEPETRFRLTYAWETLNTKRLETTVARETLQREMRAALTEGVSQSDIARMFGISRQAINEMLRAKVG